MPRVPRDSNALRQIRAHLGADPMAKILLAGHIGVGKSTELAHLAGEMNGERWVIKCSVTDSLGVHNVNAFSLLVVLLEASINSWLEAFGDMPPGIVEMLAGHAGAFLPDEKRPEKATLGKALYSAGLSNSSRARNGQDPPKLIRSAYDLSELYGEVLRRLALHSVTIEQATALDPSPLALSCELVLGELEDQAQKPVLLLIDDLDKVRDDDVRNDVFLNRAMAWLRLPCGIVSTLPLDALFSPIGPELDHVWFDVQVLDPFPVPEAEGEGLDDPPLQPYLSVLRSIGAHDVFSALQCRRLANASSGLPRMFVSACAACVAYAIEDGSQHVRDFHVDLVLRDIADRWRGRLNDSDYQALVDVIDSGGANVPGAIKLLRDGVLVRDGGASPEKQFRLANWAEPLVESYRRRRQPPRSVSTPSG